MSRSRLLSLVLAQIAALSAFGVVMGATAVDSGGAAETPTAAASTPPAPISPLPMMHPMQVLMPPMWQPRPPPWYRPDLDWRPRQPEPEATTVTDEERPARSHWQRHAPEWMNLPPTTSRTTLWKPRPLSPSAVDSEVTPVEVPPPSDVRTD